MRRLARSLLAEFQKTRRMPVRIMHLVIPVGAAGLFLLYARYTPWNECEKVAAYFQILGAGYPFLIGLFCAMASEQEQTAGGCQEMLAAPGRISAFWGKLLFLILLGFCAVCLAVFLFGMGYPKKMESAVFQDHHKALLFYAKASLALWGSSLFLYILHLFLALRFDKSVSMVLGVVESLISALFLTGMGEGIWIFVPASWASRLVTVLTFVESGTDFLKEEFQMAIGICALLTVAGASGFSIWCCRWEGKRGND